MNSQFTRIVWKEYRAQRMLWFALLLGYVLLSVLSLSMFGPNIPQLTGLAFVLSTCFAVGSIAMGFSGEEEDGTAIWPRMFPVSTRTLVTAKLAWTITAMLGLLIFTAATGLVIAAVGKSWVPAIRMPAVYGVQLEDVLVMVAIMFCVVSCALFCSLRSRRVLLTLACCSGLFVLFIATAFSLDDKQRPGLLSLFSVPVAAAAALSTRRWHLGRLGSQAPSILTKQRTLNEIARTTSLWMRPLKWAASRPSLHVRTTAVLLWLEIRRATWFVACFVSMGFICCGVQLAARFDSVFTITLLLIAVLESGLRSFRHDQQQLNGMFWSHRGISPALVWLTRTSVWFLAMLITVVCLVSIDVLQVTAATWLLGSDQYWEKSLLKRILLDLDQPPEPIGFQLQYLIATAGVGGFALSQLASCWIRKPLLATFVAIIGFLGLCWWIGYSVDYSMPLSLLSWPSIPLLFLAAFLTRRQWMDRRTSIQNWLQRGIGFALLSMCLWQGSQIWWAHEIPANLVYLSSKAIDRNNPHSVAEQAGYTVKNATGKWAAAWMRLANLPPTIFRKHILAETVSPFFGVEQDEETAVGIVDEISAMIDESSSHARSIPPQFRQPWRSRALGVATTNILLFEAKQSAEAGRIDEATRRIIESVRLSRLCIDGSANWGEWYATISHERLALSMLCQYASDDGFTSDQLMSLNAQLTEIFAKQIQITSVPLNRFLAYDQIANNRQEGWRLADPVSPGGDGGQGTWSHELQYANWASRQRFLRHCAFYVDYWGENSTESTQTLQRWKETSKLAQSLLDEWPHITRPSFKANYQYQTLLGLTNEERATQVILGLQVYRRKHGQFPESLSDLREVGFKQHDQRVQDCFCGVEFGYAPNGYGEPVPMSMPADSRIIKLNPAQPLLWGHGPVSPRITSQLGGVARLPAEPLNPNLILFNNGSRPESGQIGLNEFQQTISKQLMYADDDTADPESEEPSPKLIFGTD